MPRERQRAQNMELQSIQEKGARERNETVKRLKLCFCCLNGRQRAKQCKLKRSCGKDGCTRKHNIMLHMNRIDRLNNHLTDSETNLFFDSERLQWNPASGVRQVIKWYKLG